jgi:hypothetical protein
MSKNLKIFSKIYQIKIMNYLIEMGCQEGLQYSHFIHDDFCIIHVQFDGLLNEAWNSFNDVHGQLGQSSPNPADSGVSDAYGIWGYEEASRLIGNKSLYIDPNTDQTGGRHEFC